MPRQTKRTWCSVRARRRIATVSLTDRDAPFLALPANRDRELRPAGGKPQRRGAPCRGRRGRAVAFDEEQRRERDRLESGAAALGGCGFDECGRRLRRRRIPAAAAPRRDSRGWSSRRRRKSAERAHEPPPRLLAVRAVGDDLGEQQIVVGRDDGPLSTPPSTRTPSPSPARQADDPPVDGRKSAAGSSA